MSARVTCERRIMRRTSSWTYRCPARHYVVITVRGVDEPVVYREVFAGLHNDCEPPTPSPMDVEAVVAAVLGTMS